MPSYTFSTDKVDVHNCRSKGQHNDSDWLSLVLKINDQHQAPGPFNIGPNIHSGDTLKGPWTIGPVQINDTDNVSFAYLLLNLGHEEDINKQTGLAIQVNSDFLGAALSTAGPLGAVVGAFVAVIGNIIGWVIGLDPSNPDCNGEVLHDTFDYPPGQLMRQGTPHTVSNDYTVISPSECGGAPQTTVTYSIIDGSSVKQLMMIHELDPNLGLRHIRPPVTSLKAFMTH
jgi:hypothetical protein